MLRVVSRLAKPSKGAAQLARRSFAGASFTHGVQCRCVTCAHLPARHFSVKSQTRYDVPKTQTAVMYEADNAPLQVREDWPVVQPEDLKPGEVLVRMAYTGVCHSDLSVWEGGGPPLPKQFPMVGGHEGAGYIAAIGEHTRTSLKIGDAVGVKWLAHTCLGCEDCRKGYETTCPSAGVHGLTCHGSFQQWCVSFADHVTPIPASLDLASAAPILCAGMTVYKALKQIGGSPGEYVVIPGAGGGLGHLACQYARAMGYKVVAIDTGDDKRKLIESYGIKDFIDFKEGDVIDKVRAATGGRGGHATIVVAGSKDAYKDALMYLRPRGTLVAVGVPKDTAIVAPVEPLIPLEFRIVGSYVGSRQDAIEAINLAADGQVKSSYTVEPLTNLPDVFKRMHGGKLRGRVVLDCA
ncbi:alcohol dehydrogenase [Phytophthora ramorum]